MIADPCVATHNQWPSAEVMASVVTLALVCTALAFVVFLALIAEVGPVRATVSASCSQ